MLNDKIAQASDPRISDVADEIGVLVGKYPKPVVIEALAQVVSLLCVTKSHEESRASLAEFMSSAERKRGLLEELFACRR